MKKIFLLLVLFIVMFGVPPCSVQAENKNVSIEFSYAGPVASEFRVYCNDKVVHTIPYGNTSAIFIMDITENYLKFEVASVDAGLEYKSSPYPVTMVKEMEDFKIGNVIHGRITIKYS